MRVHDWTATRVGPVEKWPAQLVAAVQILLGVPQPAFVLWGRDALHFYNDGWVPFLGTAHPVALGQPAPPHIGELGHELQHLDDIAGSHARRHLRLVHGEGDELCLALALMPIGSGPERGLFCLVATDDGPRPIQLTRPQQLAEARDETLRAQARADKERLERILYGIRDAVVMLDRGWRYTYVNPHAAEVVGMTPEVMLGRVIWELFPEVIGSELHQRAYRAADSGETEAFELYSADHRRWYEHRLYPMPDGMAIFSTDITPRKTAEERIRESEERCRVALQNAPIIVGTADRELRYTWVHNLPRGVDPQTFLGHRDDEIMRPELALPLVEMKRQALETGCGERRELCVQSGDKLLIYDITIEPLRGADGKIVGVTSAAVDITERRRREDHQRFLAEVGSLLATSLDYEVTLANVCRLAVPLLADWCILDLVGKEGQIRRVEVATGDPEKARVAQELCQRHPPSPVEGDDLHGSVHAIRTGESQLYRELADLRLLTPVRDPALLGSLASLSLCSGIVVPLLARGRALGAITLLTERSRRRYGLEDLWLAQELALRGALAVDNARLYRDVEVQAETLRGILAASMDQLYVMDAVGRYLYMSATGAPGGYTPEQMIGKTWRELGMPAALMERIDSHRCEVMSTGQAGRYEHSFTDATGTHYWEYTLSPLKSGSAGPVAVVGISRDVTQRRRVEEALKESDRRKNEFLAMLAHELRNPLAPIRNSVEVLRIIGLHAPAQRQACEMLARQTTHLSRLVDDLLDMSRVTQGKILLRKQRLNLVELVRATAGDHREILEKAGLLLVVELPARPLWVVGDPTRLSQILGNLLHNARKFTDPGGAVTVQLVAEADGHGARLTVRDTGIGMDEDILSRLFEPFSQADGTLARSHGGLGLGLALVKGLVELHGGTAHARSAGRGRGSELAICLPLTDEPNRGEASSPAPSGAARVLRILLIEDNQDAAESLRMLLEMAEHHVAVAHSGPEGMLAVRDSRPDMVLCDIGLPGDMDGYAVAAALHRELGQTRPILIALTGYGQDEDQRRARQAGFDYHLTKPVEPRTLLELLGSATPRG